jgi:hypothetical protein
MMSGSARERGFTQVELAAVVLVLAMLGFLAFILVSPTRRCGARQLHDATQVRGIHQAMTVWAQNNRDCYPLPSQIDLANATVPEQGPAKNTTSNIMSILLWNGSISAETLYSPAEASSNIRVYEDYQFNSPKAAVDPAHALWDPGLSADFTSPKGGHISYAHRLPSGPRLSIWTGTERGATAMQATLGNRGPQITAATPGRGSSVKPVLANPSSATFLIHGRPDRWEGNIAFNDNHVDFLTALHASEYTTAAGAARHDLLFYDEPDDPKGANDFLAIFPKAGPMPKDFRAIWD